MTEFETQLAEIDQQISNLMQMNTSDHAVASGIGALQGRRAALLNEYGKQVIEGSEKTLKKQKATMTALKEKREAAKVAVVETFNKTATAVKVLRDTELAIKEAHKELTATALDISRTQGKPFDHRPAAAIHYRAIGKRDRLGALDAWYETFASHFGKLAIQTDNTIKITRERFFDVG